MFWLSLLIIFWLCMHAINVIVIAEFGWIYHPADIYKHSDILLNWFGAIFLYILWFVSSPIYGVIGFIIWACTVGRGSN